MSYVIETVWERRPPNAATRRDLAAKAAKAAALALRAPPVPPTPRGCIEIVVGGWRLDLESDATCHIARIPAERGALERGTGLQLEPDSPAGFEIVAAYVHGIDVSADLTADQISEIEQQTQREIARNES